MNKSFTQRIVVISVILIALTAFGNRAFGQNLYSRQTNNWDAALTWYTDAARTIPFVGTPGVGHTLNIGSGHVITFQSGSVATFAGIVVNDNATSGTFTVGNNGTVGTVLTVSGTVLINTSGIFQSGATGATAHRVNLAGALTNSNVFNMTANAATNQTIAFTGTSQSVTGAGATFTFRNLSLNTAAATNVSLSSNIQIAGVLDFTTDGLLVVGTSNNVTLASTATITNNGSARYVQLDGLTGVASQLIRVNSGATADWKFLFPIGTSTGGYSPADLSAATVTTAPVAASTLAVKAIYNSSVIGQMRRTFRLVVAANGNATTFTSPNFTFANPSTPDISQGDVLANYNTIWYLNLSTATWATLAGTAPGATFFTPTAATSLGTGTYYYTLGNSTAYPNTWYSYQTGVWSNPDVWTLDPSGTSLINPLTQIPLAGDQVAILNGFTVTNDVNNLSQATTTIEGGATLDMAATIGNTLGTVKGAGILRVNGVGLPTGVYNSFVTAGTGGTVEFYNTTGTIPTPGTNPALPSPTYNNLHLSNGSGAAAIFTLASNLVVNSNLNVTQTGGGGTVTWQINNAAATTRTITIAGDLTVSASGKITAGTGLPAAQHSLTITGNFTNSGVVQFFDPTDANFASGRYTTASSPNVFTTALQGNAVNVTFNGTNSKTVTCNSQTDFYRLILSKGTGQQAILTINSTATGNFRLFGPTNRASTGAAPSFVCQNSLSIQNGTLQLTGNISIPSMAEEVSGDTNGYPIPQNGALWINGNVTIVVSALTGSTVNDNGRRILLSGLLKMTSGSLTTGVGTTTVGYTKGISAEDDGSLIIQGGTITTSQLRTRVSGVNNFAYAQSGGIVNVGTINGVDTGFARFDIQFTTCTFIMTGGTLTVANPANNTPSGIRIGSAASSYLVTGGTVNATLTTNTGITTYDIQTTAPFFNLNINRTGAGGTTTAQLSSSLVVLNNLTLLNATNSPTLNCNGNNLTVGGNFDIQTGTTFTPGANTVTFNGSGAQSWTHNGTITSLNNIVVSKSAGTLTLGGANVFPNMVGLTLTAGTLNDGGKTLTVTTTLGNSATHSGSGAIQHSAAGAATITGTGGTFGNLTINTDANVTMSGAQTITGNLRLLNANSTLNIGSNSLTVQTGIFADGAGSVLFTNAKRIRTNGLRNDGGLTRRATSAADLLFPVGTATILYTPITINATATTAGTITVQPVNGAHPNVTAAGASLRYFWRVSSLGFAGITVVTHKSYTFSNAVLDPTITAYSPARYDPSTFTWSYRTATYDATATTMIPDFNTGTLWTGSASDKLDGEYTAGNQAAFGAVTVYYSRNTGTWSTPAIWSTDPVLKNGGGAAATQPCSTCPVVIGDATHTHVVTNNVNGQACGSLYIDLNSTLDCASSTGLNFGVNTTGTGTLRIGAVNFPAGDFINFLGPNGGTVEWYGGNYTIPSVSPTANINLVNYYNLIINATTGPITFPNNDLVIYHNFVKSGAQPSQTNIGGTHAITINGNLDVTGGSFFWQNGTATNFTVSGTTTFGSGTTISVPGGGAQTHTFTTSGSIVSNGTFMVLKNAAHVVNLVFTGTSPTSLTGTNAGATTTLNLITVNKGTTQAPTVTIGPLAGTVNTLTNAWLTLVNGTMNFNVAASTFILTNVAATPYSIPTTASLKCSSGTVNISSIASNTSDLLLSGTLEVAGGTVNVGPLAGANDNDIEYSSAGTPTIIVSGAGILYVNGSIRRPATTLSGALVYNQSGTSTVTVAGRNSDNSRGVFEIESSTGSSFTMAGTATLTVSRSTGGATYADLYINPVTSSIASTSFIQIGANALGAQTLSVNIVPAIGNFTVLGAAGNAQTVNMRSSILSSSGTLTINTASILNTNSLDVNIGGNLSISGTYNGSNNTTTFNGSGAQSGALTAGSTFNNITINKSAGTASLTGNTTITNFNILSGTVDVAGTLSVNGNITNNSSQTGAGIISLTSAATTHSITSNGGSFTNLSVVGSGATNNVFVDGNMTINGVLTFTGASRFLNIGSDLLTFGSSASIVGAGATAFIRTNGVSSDLGVTRNWPAGGTSFTYALGSLNNYTPLIITLNVTGPGAGTLNVVPVNQRHPTYNVASTERVLNYYWIVTRGSTLAYTATGNQQYQFPSALMGGALGTLAAAYLDLSAATLGWNTTDPSGSATTTSMTFANSTSTNLPTAGQTFHYSVGTSNSLPNPINPVYSLLDNASVSNPLVGGNWNAPASWTASSTGHGSALGSAPTGVPVVILSGARINMNVNARSAFTTTLDGTLVLGTSFGHNLGIISGAGTMRTSTNTFPAGIYAKFVLSTGGTIEYVAPMVMNSRTVYNNLSFSGAGTVTMTNSDLILNGGFNIMTAGITVDNSINNRSIALAGNWSNSGTFNAGTGTVAFTGSAAQTITGATTFNNLTILKSNNLTLNTATTVNGVLTLTSGNIISSTFPTASRLLLSLAASVSGGSPISFVEGRMSKTMALGESFIFPLGSTATSNFRPVAIDGTGGPASDTWTASYIGHDPSTDGFPFTSINPANMKKVSMFEYWQVANASGTGTGSLTLSYGAGSYSAGNVGVLALLKTAQWAGTFWDLPPGGGTFTQSGSSSVGTVTVSFQNSFGAQTLASDDQFSSLPIELLDFSARLNGTAVELNWSTASELNNDYFTIEKTSDLEKFEAVQRVPGQGTKSGLSVYSTVDGNPFAGKSYYRLKQTDINGKFTYSGLEMVDNDSQNQFKLYPNPIVDDKFMVELHRLQPMEEVRLKVISMQGSVVFDFSLRADINGNVKKELEIGQVANGLYTVILISSTGAKKNIIIE